MTSTAPPRAREGPNADRQRRAFDVESPIYYALRLARGDARGAWALRFIHHKLYLTNPPPEVECFSVSHGYNLLTLERAFPPGGFDLCAAAGLVIAHPESTLRGETRRERAVGNQGGGYFLTGPTAALAARRSLLLGTHVAIVPELRLTLSRARVQIAAGQASVPNAALHLIVGLELRFRATHVPQSLTLPRLALTPANGPFEVSAGS